MQWLKHNMAYVGAALTAIYVVVIIALGFKACPSLAFNEWGDYFAGFMSPVALFWLIGTLFIQRQELALQRQEMAEARLVAKQQAEEQRRTAEANLKANLIAERATIHEMSGKYKNVLQDIKDKIASNLQGFSNANRKKLYSRFDNSNYDAEHAQWIINNKILNDHEFVIDINNHSKEEIANTFAVMLTILNERQLKFLRHTSSIAFSSLHHNMEDFLRVFSEFNKRVVETDSSILIDPEDLFLARAIGRYFDLQNKG
jgi:hypothetical protein